MSENFFSNLQLARYFKCISFDKAVRKSARGLRQEKAMKFVDERSSVVIPFGQDYLLILCGRYKFKRAKTVASEKRQEAECNEKNYGFATNELKSDGVSMELKYMPRETSFCRRQLDRPDGRKGAKPQKEERASEGRRGHGEAVERRRGKRKGRRRRKRKRSNSKSAVLPRGMSFGPAGSSH